MLFNPSHPGEVLKDYLGDMTVFEGSEKQAAQNQTVSGIETASLKLGSDRSRGYCLEMICADFLAGANLDHGDPEMLLFSMTRFFKFLPEEQRQAFLRGLSEKAS
jgi:hypothetical protein